MLRVAEACEQMANWIERRATVPDWVSSESTAASVSHFEFFVNEQFCSDRVDRQPHNFPIKSIIKDAAALKHVGANSRESSCTNHNAIAITRRNVCGPLNRRPII